MDKGITINGIHTCKDLGLDLLDYTLSALKPKLTRIAIPGRKTELDITEALTGRVTYESRTLTANFEVLGTTPAHLMHYDSLLQNAFAGQKLKVILDDEPDKFWLGRMETITVTQTEPNVTAVEMAMILDPYRYFDDELIGNPWKWNPFNFHYGVVNNTFYNVDVEEEETVSVVAPYEPVQPTLIATADMVATVKGDQYQLTANVPQKLSCTLEQHEVCPMTFAGTGRVSIVLKGEML